MLRLREGPTRQQTLLKVAEIYQKSSHPSISRQRQVPYDTNIFICNNNWKAGTQVGGKK